MTIPLASLKRSSVDKVNNLPEQIYSENQRFIKALAQRYSKIDSAVGYEDLMSEGFIAIMEAVHGFNFQKSNLNFSSYLWWHLQKRFQSVLGTDKVVEVDIDGEKDIISYTEFLRVKKGLPEGTTWRVTSLLSSFEELIGRISGQDD
jgi:RNA polymerase sigma factor (sigma-70 family)